MEDQLDSCVLHGELDTTAVNVQIAGGHTNKKRKVSQDDGVETRENALAKIQKLEKELDNLKTVYRVRIRFEDNKSDFYQSNNLDKEFIVPKSDLDNFVRAGLKLYHTPGINEHSENWSKRMKLMTVRKMELTDGYWWTSPTLSTDADNDVAQRARIFDSSIYEEEETIYRSPEVNATFKENNHYYDKESVHVKVKSYIHPRFKRYVDLKKDGSLMLLI